MITQRPTEEMIAQWKAVWRENKDRLSPNRKTGPQVLEYLQNVIRSPNCPTPKR